MSTVLVTGAAGLIGSETVRHFARKGHQVVGLDNDMRKYFFGDGASTSHVAGQLRAEFRNYEHHAADIRDVDALNAIFARHGAEVTLVVHAAAQPSHDWAAREPLTDFSVNATGTLNVLEVTRTYAPEAVFIFTSTNKVYGDTPNRLPLMEQETRWEVDPAHTYAERGIDESMSLDQTMHSVFGASKVAADVMVQEYGRYFGMRTSVFRGGCLSGPAHAGAELHGFLAYLMKCAVTGTRYRVFGYKGKQVRDNIHAADLVEAFDRYFQEPRPGEVYNIGGARASNCSMQEAMALCESITGRPMNTEYVDEARAGDHVWWISDISKFQAHYPGFEIRYKVPEILRQIYEAHSSG